jgi:2-polyprenyl-3-methyl-5-hydroxy-6-metoxy-1,4-benzoquinol methylase
MEDNRLEDTYESPNIITRTYFRTKVWLAVKIARLKKDEIILDFGCGGGWLEKKLKGYKIYGYDINPKKTFIKNYKKVSPNKIFALDVFEHIPADEIGKIIDNFKKMNKNFELIVSIPTENKISRMMRKFVGKIEVPKEHITKYPEILKILNSKLKLVKKINFLTVSYIAKFRNI